MIYFVCKHGQRLSLLLLLLFLWEIFTPALADGYIINIIIIIIETGKYKFR